MNDLDRAILDKGRAIHNLSHRAPHGPRLANPVSHSYGLPRDTPGGQAILGDPRPWATPLLLFSLSAVRRFSLP